MKPLSMLCCLLFLFACGAKVTEDPGDNGGNTNWLKSCDDDSECGDDDGMCVSEVCLKACTSDDACDGIANTECRSLEPTSAPAGSCGALPETSLCALLCDGDADCSALGDAYSCSEGVCAPTCPAPGDPSPDAGGTPDPDPVDEDECVVAIDVGACCPEAFATRRSELEASECWYEVVDGNYEQPSGLPGHCYPSCPEIPCPPSQSPGWYGVAVEDDAGSCVIEPVCDDASCPGSACDPAVGCDRDWVDPVNGFPGLQCEATACGEPGVCVYVQRSCVEIYDPVCGCDGVTYENHCTLGDLAPIRHEGECEPAPSTPVDDECVVAMDISECCPQAFAARRSELEASECWYEVIEGDYSQPSGYPDACYPSCVEIACPPPETPGWYGAAVEDPAGACVIQPACDDASCPGSACDPVVGCDRDWVDPVSGLSGLLCQAASCGEPGVCVYPQLAACDTVYDPVCGCDGVLYDNRCTWGEYSPILPLDQCPPVSE